MNCFQTDAIVTKASINLGEGFGRTGFTIYYTWDDGLYPYNSYIYSSIHRGTQGHKWHGEVAVFREGVRGETLVNMRKGDDALAWQAIAALFALLQ